MAQTNFNVGTIANDGTGEALRVAFQEQQAMNTELYTTKVDKVVGKDLSDNNYTDDEVIKLAGIEEGAEVNVQADWEQSDDTQDDYIKNKPTEMFSSVGYFHYTDTATQTTPLTIVADTNKKLTNDGLGAQTNLTQAPYGVSTLFNTTTNEFDFSQLAIGDTLDLRVDLSLTTGTANQNYLVFLRVGEGSPSQYDLPIFSGQIKSASSNNRIIGNEPFSIDYQDHIDYPATLYILSDHSGSLKVNGWYTAIVRKSVNIINVKNNRQVKLISGTAPYELSQDDSVKFLAITTEYDIILPLELEDYTEFWIKNISGSEREVTFDTNIVFEGSPLIPDNGLCILKKIYASGVIETWSVNVISEGSGGGSQNLDQTLTIGNTSDKNIKLLGHTVNQGINWTTVTGGNEALEIQATVDATTSTSDVSGVLMNFPTLGANSNIDGVIIRLSPGYTGNKIVRALNAHSLVAGAMTLNLLDESGTIGASFQSQGNSTGDNIGVYAIGGFAQGRNIAGYFRAMQDNAIVTSTHQIGIMAIAGKHDNLSGNFIGGYFGLMSHHDHRIFLDRKAALIANNGDIDASIIVGKSIGVDVFEVKSKGQVLISPSDNSIVPFTINTLLGQSTNILSFNVDAINKFRISQNGDAVLAGRLLFQENAGATTVQALYSESGTNHVVLRTGPTANVFAFKRADASTIGTIRGATSTFIWGSSFNSGTITSPPVDGMLIQGKVNIGSSTSPTEQFEVTGTSKFTGNIGVNTIPVSYASLAIDGSATTYGIDVTSSSAGNVFRDPAGYIQQSSDLLRSSSSNNFDIQSSSKDITFTTGGTERLRLNNTTGNAEFSGTVSTPNDIEITDSSKGIILKDTVLGTRHRIQLVSGVLTVSAAL